MQSEYAVPSADVGLIDITSSTMGGHRTPEHAVRGDHPDSNQRWRQWCARGAQADRETARTTNRGFIAIFVTVSAWLGVQLLS